MNDELRREIVALLQRILGDQPVPEDLRRGLLEYVMRLGPEGAADVVAPAAAVAADLQPAGAAAIPVGGGPVSVRKLVYVHGICQHGPGFSNGWWNALHPFVPTAFGAGQLGGTRLEVIWSDLVNAPAAALAAALGGAAPDAAAVLQNNERAQVAAEIRETLRDRADQQRIPADPATALAVDGGIAGPAGLSPALPQVDVHAVTGGSLAGGGAGLNCIDDFSIYLINNQVRQAIIDRFLNVVRPQLQAGHELDIISHSWGTVVSYEGLRQLEDEGLAPPVVRNFFTVGAALSIGPVKFRLRPQNKNGRKPGSVRRWINLDATGDIVGGPLQGRPYAVDFDFVNLNPVGCGSFLGLVDPRCAHSSYFAAANAAVNRNIFARFINS